MGNELIYIEDFTIIKNQTMIHRNNEDEWKYVGIWGDMLDEKLSCLIKSYFSSDCLSNLFIAFGHYKSTLEIIQENLSKRNKYNQGEFLKNL